MLSIGLACAPHVINNVLAVKDIRYFKWAPLVAFIVYGIVMFLLKFAGFAGMSMVEEGLVVLPDVKNASDYIYVLGVEYALPSVVLSSILGVIILAAVMSTTDRLMLTIGTYFSWDIFKKILKPDAPEKQVLLVSRLAVLAAAAVTLLMAINPPDMLVWLIWAGIGIMFSTFAVPLLAGLYWRGATRDGAIASMALGLIAAIFFGGLSYFKIKLFTMPMHFSFYAFVISVIAMIVVSMMTKKTPDTVLDETMTGWYFKRD